MNTKEIEIFEKNEELLQLLKRIENVGQTILKTKQNTTELQKDLKTAGLADVAFLLETGFQDFAFRFIFLQNMVLDKMKDLKNKNSDFSECIF